MHLTGSQEEAVTLMSPTCKAPSKTSRKSHFHAFGRPPEGKVRVCDPWWVYRIFAESAMCLPKHEELPGPEALVPGVTDVQDLVPPEMLDGYLAKVVVECVDLSGVG